MLKPAELTAKFSSGEKKNYNIRPTFSSKENWYDLGKREFGDAVAWIYIINDRYVTFQNGSPKVYLDSLLSSIEIARFENKKNMPAENAEKRRKRKRFSNRSVIS